MCLPEDAYIVSEGVASIDLSDELLSMRQGYYSLLAPRYTAPGGREEMAWMDYRQMTKKVRVLKCRIILPKFTRPPGFIT